MTRIHRTRRTAARRIPGAIAASALPLVVLAGCSVSVGAVQETVNKQQIEQQLTEQFSAQGVLLTDVTCADIEAKVGAPVSCTGQNPIGATLKLEGSITEVDGDRYRTNVTAVSATIDGARIAEQAKALLEQQVGEKADSMTCPETIEIPTTQPVRCELVVGATHLGTSVTIDKDFNLQVQVDQP